MAIRKADPELSLGPGSPQQISSSLPSSPTPPPRPWFSQHGGEKAGLPRCHLPGLCQVIAGQVCRLPASCHVEYLSPLLCRWSSCHRGKHNELDIYPSSAPNPSSRGDLVPARGEDDRNTYETSSFQGLFSAP